MCLMGRELDFWWVHCRPQKKSLTEEERESQAKSLYSEFLSANDHVEALTLARELAAPGKSLPCQPSLL